ncbi:C-type lectin domain family 2 member B-like [Pelodiscus sinensis]|uniref:C-type lectin domain family 2 member B-like n=1 Tax=Pelodiscus sinensis TaxID=13735 RepID=UPI003F6BE77B
MVQTNMATDLSDPRKMENGETRSNLLPNGTAHKDEKFSGLWFRLKALAQRCAVLNLLLVLLQASLVVILIIILAARPDRISEPSPTAAACSVTACPDGWVGYRGKCYYFSESEATWTDSQKNCSAHGASLAGIDTQQEMDFIRRYKDPSSRYWIGLRREPGQPWRWTNGTVFSGWFAIAGGEWCAFLSNGHCGSSHCSGEGRWICSEPARSPEGGVKSPQPE